MGCLGPPAIIWKNETRYTCGAICCLKPNNSNNLQWIAPDHTGLAPVQSEKRDHHDEAFYAETSVRNRSSNSSRSPGLPYKSKGIKTKNSTLTSILPISEFRTRLLQPSARFAQDRENPHGYFKFYEHQILCGDQYILDDQDPVAHWLGTNPTYCSQCDRYNCIHVQPHDPKPAPQFCRFCSKIRHICLNSYGDTPPDCGRIDEGALPPPPPPPVVTEPPDAVVPFEMPNFLNISLLPTPNQKRKVRRKRLTHSSRPSGHFRKLVRAIDMVFKNFTNYVKPRETLEDSLSSICCPSNDGKPWTAHLVRAALRKLPGFISAVGAVPRHPCVITTSTSVYRG